MSFLIGIGFALAGIFLAMHELDQTIANYMDPVAILVVLGGTFGILMVVIPWASFKKLIHLLFRSLLIPESSTRRKFCVRRTLEFVYNENQGISHSFSKSIQDQILSEGLELKRLGMKREDIEEILIKRINEVIDEGRRVGNAFKSAAKYPPAFGLMGTVFGLVELMKAITEGLDPSQTGSRMAIALVATLYGLVMANLIIGPIGESFYKTTEDEQKSLEICLEAVCLVADGANLLKSQETLNSFLPKKYRLDLIGQISAGGAL